MTQWILGLNCYDHDVAVCLVRDGALAVAVNKERVTRLKHDAGFFGPAIDYCLETAGIKLDDVDLVVRNSYLLPVHEMERTLAHHHQPAHLPRSERAAAFASPIFLEGGGGGERIEGGGGGGRIAGGGGDASPPVESISHHLAHAYSAFAVAPFDEGAVMVVDGVGSYRADVLEPVPEADETGPLARESESYYRFSGTELTTLKKVWLEPAKGFLSEDFYHMAGLGAVYSRVSTYVFGDWNKCGEVMGLAPYGRNSLPRLMWLDDDGNFAAAPWDEALRRPFLGGTDKEWEASEHRRHWEDLCFRAQDDAEEILLARARWLHEATGHKNLCLAGGVALNCVANGRILRETPFENVYIQPAAGDDGIAIGCAYWGHLARRGGKRTFVMRHAYLGRTHDRFDIAEAVRPFLVRATTRRRRSDDFVREAAQRLAAGKVLGWVQGGSEFGPRALGNRSILADPRTAAMKDHVNARVKRRQGFRPFAPAVLADRAHEFFEGDAESPHMLLVKAVLPAARDKVAGIVHVDGTARVQTVRQEDNPVFYALIKAFGDLTGVPVLLNTSFNLRGDPIVEHPIDAVETLLDCGLDAVVIHDWIIDKRWTWKVLRRLVRTWLAARRRLRVRPTLDKLAESAAQ